MFNSYDIIKEDYMTGVKINVAKADVWTGSYEYHIDAVSCDIRLLLFLTNYYVN
jgi:hypothetical protein